VLRPEVVPTDKQLESWKDDKMYGVWIDGKRIGNETLEKYDKIDFSMVFVSGLAKNAKNYGKHYYQVNLMTNEYYSDYNKGQISKKDSYKMVYSNPPKPRI
jgi:CTP:phosphocholine cytidylyltransferase-like protein